MNAKIKVALRMSQLNPSGKVTFGKNVSKLMKASSRLELEKLPFSMNEVDLSLDGLNNSIQVVASGAAGAKPNRDYQESIVMGLFNMLRAHVESVALKSSDPRSIIEEAGMYVVEIKGSTPVTDLTLTALGGGIVEVWVPRRRGEVSFTYQYSTDKGNTWLEFEQSKLATVQLKGLNPGDNIFFRFAPVAKTKGQWCQPKSVIVT